MPKKNYTDVLVEGLRSDFKFVIEKVTGLEEKIEGVEDRLTRRMDERFDQIEATLANA